jgi:hypothetical protein
VLNLFLKSFNDVLNPKGDRMNMRFLTALAVVLAITIAMCGVGHAQSFKVEKFDIKGEGGTDYVSVESATGRVFVSRGDHVMVVEGATGKVLGDVTNTPGVHGAGIATKSGHGFTTNGGNSMVTMFDLKTLAPIKQIPVMQGGLDGIMYDFAGAKTITVDPSTHNAYLFQPERGPAPAPAAGAPPAAGPGGGRGRGAPGPIVAAWFIVIKQ